MINNEYGRLKAVALHKPCMEELTMLPPEKAMYATAALAPDYYKVTQEFNEYVILLKSLGIEVYIDEGRSETACPNNIFMRDIAAVIGNTLVIGTPAYDIRKPEVYNFKRFIMESGLHAKFDDILELNGTSTFEGADLFVVDNREIVISVGNRTNIEAHDRIKQYFSRKGWKVNLVQAAPEGIPQHILGAKHIIDSDTLISRSDLNDAEVHSDFTNIIPVPEHSEAVTGYSCNVVTVGPKEIIMPAGNPETRKLYESHGIKVHETTTHEIGIMAGSLACMTLPLKRETNV